MLFFGKPSARLPVRRRASSWRSRRRGPEPGEFEMGGGVFKHKTRRQAPTAFEKSPTRRAAKAAMWRQRACARRGVLVSRLARSRARRVPRRPPPHKFSPTRDAASSGAAACARRRELTKRTTRDSNRESHGTQPGSGTKPEAADGGGPTNSFSRAAVAKPGDGGGPTNTFTMDEKIESATAQSTREQPICQFNPRSPSWSPRRSADLEFRQLQYASEADVSRTRTCVHIRCMLRTISAPCAVYT